jgi:hypothetical protein
VGGGGALILPDVAPGKYFVVVDGSVAGTYFFSVHCSPAAPTATPSNTPTLTPTRTLTATRTGTPPAPPFRRYVFLPLAMKGRSRALSQGWASLERRGQRVR